ncbi:restriction endonuclease subunit S [Acidithiobacillus ferriphilus]|uniref:restriction endonuclease subunit S n=1 Tax=Acidithiobacillus ferriphilus TaxID=1689834 RepID=UPI0023304CD4|nr:restriction endonuclease subunit S [Acidithiobacillus ferriphilus]WCE93534.1 restriction endonuclease subunit S [Acidithiobacillus ferriphilus]
MTSKTAATATKEEAMPALVPKLRFPEFREAEGWDVDPLGDVADFVNEKIPLEQVALENYVSTENILPDYGGVARASKLPTTASVTRFKPNDTLVSNIRPYLKKVWVADKEGGASNDVIVIRAKQRLLPQYFSCLLKNDAFIDYVMTGAKGVKMPRGDVASMKAYPVLYPSKPEQQKIAECLSSVDELMAAQARKVDALKTYKKGLMQQLFPREGETQPRLRFPEFQNAGEWEVKAIGDVFRVTRGEVLSMTLVKDEASNEAPFPVYSSQTKNKGLAGYYSEYLYEGAITWTTDGANAGDVNFRPGKFYCTNVCGVLINTHGYANACVAALLNSVTRSHVSYVGNPKLMNGVMAKIEIPFPPLAEQQRIASCLSSLDALIAAETQKLEALKTHKKGLMQQLFPVLNEVEG